MEFHFVFPHLSNLHIFSSFLATRQPNLTGRTSLFLLSVINRNAHNNNAHSAGHKNMNKVVCVFLFVPFRFPLFVCLSLSFCFACQLAVNRLADKNVKSRPELAQPQSPLAAIQLADCNLHRSSTALQSLCLHASLPACGLSHVPCTHSLPALTISPSYRQLVSAQPAGSFQSETCAVFFFFFCSFGLALISDQGQCSLTETT